MARSKVRLEFRVFASRVFMTLWLAFAWVLLWGSFNVGTITAGVLVATFVMLVLPLPRVPVEGLMRPVSTAWLVIMVGYYLVRSSLIVAWLSVRPKAPPQPAVLRAPMRLKSDFTLALAVNSLNLMPGGIVVRVDPVARYVYVHVLDAGSDEAIEAFRRQTANVEKLYQRAFERPENWRPDPDHYTAPADSGPADRGPADTRPANRGSADSDSAGRGSADSDSAAEQETPR
ncbi:Na+/H+ antiporter subunit E [Dietzia alimentaria]|uniref:Na+/H+ antiporter subunit E n=1 Tax=Dietzia alimentaria TaxID=665550 RepID=UPI00029A33DE|nr:Na+/H+ antiporter subunit E [Dietzia alimentaria]